MEKITYRDSVEVHALPDIFHYWSDRYVRPKLEAFGFSNPNALFETEAAKRCRLKANRLQRFISIGSGNCDLEVDLAGYLFDRNIHNFVIECLDLNDEMLERGRASAKRKGVSEHVEPVLGDFNSWRPKREYDIVMANQVLHDVLNLEDLFDTILGTLKVDGLFVVSDMIGRNGHLRWPEALDIVHEFWRELPENYRFNHQLRRQEETYENWDCSSESFEGIRSQDILPLLLQRFQFELFIGFGNVVDVFVDRAFGHNFDARASWDREFIDRIHARDEAEMLAGRIKPTHMLAVMHTGSPAPARIHRPFTPEFSVRWPDPPATGGSRVAAQA
jgi:SAM-dependent methyltransferase